MILRDITESRRSAQQTLESERLNALTLLAAGVAHEIGNPLNSLHIHLQLMERQAHKLDGPARAELQESIDIARSEVSRLDSIVTQFLRAIRPSKPQLHPENVNAIVDEAVRFFAPEIHDRDVVVEQELRSDLPLLQLDRDQMKQAFYNVIKNSFEAMKRRGILRIRTDMDDTHVLISFTDTGGGMSPESLSRVFEPYFTTKSSGTGLGLLIVRRIVREHGGELSIESSEGKGLTLTIRLPYIERRVRMLEAGKKTEGGTRDAEKWRAELCDARAKKENGLAELAPPFAISRILWRAELCDARAKNTSAFSGGRLRFPDGDYFPNCLHTSA